MNEIVLPISLLHLKSASYAINIGLEPRCDAWFGHDNLNTICVEEKKKREAFVSVTA